MCIFFWLPYVQKAMRKKLSVRKQYSQRVCAHLLCSLPRARVAAAHESLTTTARPSATVHTTSMLPTARFRMLLLVASPALAYPSSTKSLMVRGAETLMRPKRHGTCSKAPAETLRWGVDYATTDNICCFNRHYAEGSGSYSSNNLFMAEAKRGGEITYYDSVTRKPLFIAPRGRSLEAFLDESSHHGWPSFRDEEVVWDNVRVLSDGECVSVDGTCVRHALAARAHMPSSTAFHVDTSACVSSPCAPGTSATTSRMCMATATASIFAALPACRRLVA